MRIIAGKHKGKVLSTFEYEHIRPTSDRVKEAIFSKIQFKVPNSVVLDLFGGTGNFSFEALSRNAKTVYICDTNPLSIKIIKENNKKLGENANILLGDYNKNLKQFAKNNSLNHNSKLKFDIIFLDPPYNSDYGEKALQLIYQFELLACDGIIIFEHNYNKQFNTFGFECFDNKKYGTMEVSYLRNKND